MNHFDGRMYGCMVDCNIFATQLKNHYKMKNSFKPTSYKLKSVATETMFDDAGWTLDAPGETVPSLIRAIYLDKQLQLFDEDFGLYKYASWLPVRQMLKGSSAPVTYKSESLGKYLGLSNLYITFSGYWPEKGAKMPTCSFKETEAYSVCGRMDLDSKNVLVVASAGNTARAFARVCSDNQIPLLLCVPYDNVDALWFDSQLNDCVKLLCVESGSDYFDAIHLSNMVCKIDGFFAEGGAKNVARRDGMATTMLSATTFIGRIPDYYFQAVGSGTGAIAAWEANLRLLDDGRFGTNKMKLMVSQNKPFIPMYDAWKALSRQMLPYEDALARKDVEEIYAKVLSNRKPPYPITGGLYDALTDSKGDVLIASNEEGLAAGQLFKELEGIDIHPAAEIATATLIQAVQNQSVDKESVVMLNITGGGEERFKNDHEIQYMEPDFIFPISISQDELAEELRKLRF
jgi:cysteate synthase